MQGVGCRVKGLNLLVAVPELLEDLGRRPCGEDGVSGFGVWDLVF